MSKSERCALQAQMFQTQAIVAAIRGDARGLIDNFLHIADEAVNNALKYGAEEEGEE